MWLRNLRLLNVAAIACFAAIASADQMNAFPNLIVADGRSTTTITANIHDTSGRPVPDGTRVVFSSTLGNFRTELQTTTNGIARAILVAGGTPGIATITVTPLGGGAGPSTLDFELVADRSMLSTAREYIEVTAPGMMTYTVDSKIIGASGVKDPKNPAEPMKRVSMRYREVSIEAEDIQLNIPTYEVRARKATLHIGKFTQVFDELYLRLNQKKGFGTATYMGHAPQFLTVQGRWLAFATLNDDGTYNFGTPAPMQKYGVVAIKGPSITPSLTPVGPSLFEFQELIGSPSHIMAKKAVIFPNRRIQFQRADVYVAETKVMKLPLFQVNMQQSTSPLITEDLVNVSDNQLLVNYPYYLDLKPGRSSLLRFRTGDTYGRGMSTSTGAFLDYELNWNKGDDMVGSFAVRNIGRSDWQLGLQQYLHIDDRTSASAQVGIPADSSYYGSANATHQFNGFQTDIRGSVTTTYRGLTQTNTDVGFDTETTPRQVHGTPFNFNWGFTATESQNSLINMTQRVAGLTTHLQSRPIKIDSKTNLTTSTTVSYLQGQDTVKGLTILGNATFSHQFTPQISSLLIYDFTHDGFNDKIMGEHMLSAQTFYNSGKIGLRLFASRSLDIDRASAFIDADYKLSKSWRLSTAYTYDRFLNEEFLDYNLAIGYRVGWREIGIVWSKRTNRFGIQLLGATIN